MEILRRVSTGWTFARIIYLALGSILIMQSLIEREWWGVMIGGYFAGMGLFAFGCASGNCFGGRCDNSQEQH